ncbi:hypothetical protein [Cellulomonas soli]
MLSLSGVWWRTPAALAVALPAGLVTLALCVVGSRATTTLLSRVVARRRVRELTAVVAVLPVMFLGPIMAGLGEAGEPDGLGRRPDRCGGRHRVDPVRCRPGGRR